VSSSADPTETTNFRKLLLKKCQRKFANTVSELVEIEKKKKEIEENKDVGFYSHLFYVLNSITFYLFIQASKKEVLDDELDELTTKYRNKTRGNIR